MAVGISQLEEVFRQAREFDRDPGSLSLGSLEQNLLGVLDDFRNLRGNDARLQEMDARLDELVGETDFERPGLAVMIAHFLSTLFENYANEGRGFRKAYEFSQEKRAVSTIDGPFIYEEFVPAIFDESALRDADSLRFLLLHEVARFLEDKDPGGHWPAGHSIDQVREARSDTLLLELERRRVHHADIPNLSQRAHTLEQRLAEAGFFGETAAIRRVLAYFFERYGYIERESFWRRLRRRLSALGRGRATFGRLSRWKQVYRMQTTYMVLAVLLAVLVVLFWNWRQQEQFRILDRYYNEVSSIG
ncbi:MAG: hypothetical protein KAY32_15325 [Candidatus Eisenbacteria sp.]|nr:hypothetical protein [Candidatus Eisenbacteria bacterium]